MTKSRIKVREPKILEAALGAGVPDTVEYVALAAKTAPNYGAHIENHSFFVSEFD